MEKKLNLILSSFSLPDGFVLVVPNLEHDDAALRRRGRRRRLYRGQPPLGSEPEAPVLRVAAGGQGTQTADARTEREIEEAHRCCCAQTARKRGRD